MNNIILNIDIDDSKWEKKSEEFANLSNEVLKKTFDYVFANEDIDFLHLNKKININLSMSNDENIKELNKNYRDKDSTTNVLSFSNIDSETFEDELKLFEDIELGDIIIAYETLEKEAVEKNISFQDHYCHLLVHGILHLLGFDHIIDEEAEYMEEFETQILKNLNINNPYAEI